MADLFTLAGTVTFGFWALAVYFDVQDEGGDTIDHLMLAWHGVMTVLGLALLSNRYF